MAFYGGYRCVRLNEYKIDMLLTNSDGQFMPMPIGPIRVCKVEKGCHDSHIAPCA